MRARLRSEGEISFGVEIELRIVDRFEDRAAAVGDLPRRNAVARRSAPAAPGVALVLKARWRGGGGGRRRCGRDAAPESICAERALGAAVPSGAHRVEDA